MQTTTFPSHAIDDKSCVSNSAIIYCVGANGATGATTGNVWYVQSSSDGTLANWTQTTGYPLNVWAQSCAADSGYIYCVGGSDFTNSSEYSSVYYAPLTSTGVGSWTETISYPTVIMGASCVTASPYIYCVGGTADGATYPASGYYARLSPAGGITSNWLSFSAGFGGAPSCVVNGGVLYCIGGSWNNVAYAQLSASGGIASSGWETSTYPLYIFGQSCVVDMLTVSGAVTTTYLLCVGGFDLSNLAYPTNAVYTTELSTSPAGGIGSWTKSTYPISVGLLSCVLSSGSIYCIGGANEKSTSTLYVGQWPDVAAPNVYSLTLKSSAVPEFNVSLSTVTLIVILASLIASYTAKRKR